ncbi:MAG: response regulator [Myxococcota bacterium]
MSGILLIDAEQPFASDLVAALKTEGYAVTQLDDGKEGLEVARDQRPSLIVLCVELPKMSGYSICNKLKKDADLRDIPLIITSKEATPETFAQHKKLKTRAEDYLIKPFEPGALLEKVAALAPVQGVTGGPSELDVEAISLEADLDGLSSLRDDDDGLDADALLAGLDSGPDEALAGDDEEALLDSLGADDGLGLGADEDLGLGDEGAGTSVHADDEEFSLGSGDGELDLPDDLDLEGAGQMTAHVPALLEDDLGEAALLDKALEESSLDELAAAAASSSDDEGGIADDDLGLDLDPAPVAAPRSQTPVAPSQVPVGSDDLAALSSLRRDNTELKARVAELEARLKAAESSAKNAQETLSSTQSSSSSTAREVLNLKEQVRARDKDLDKLKDEIFEHEKRAVELQEQIDAARGEAHGFQDALAEKDTELARVSAEVEALRQERDDLEQRATERVESARAELAQQASSLAVLEQERDELSAKAAALQADAQAARHQLKAAEALRAKARAAAEQTLQLLSEASVATNGEADLDLDALDV